VSAFRIHELREQAAEVLLCRWHPELDTLRAHLFVEFLDIGDSEAQFNGSRGILLGRRMQCERLFRR
jgi:hypothetical protein